MTKTTDLQQLRGEIDAITTELVTLLNKRAAVAQCIGRAKSGRHMYDPAREQQVLEKIVQANTGPLGDQAVTAVMREVIAACRNLEQQQRVAYLGPSGTYSEQAARQHLGATCAFVSAVSIDEVVRLAEQGKVQLAVVPIENSTEGAVNQTLDLLVGTNLQICGEILMPIHHQLLTYAESLQMVTEVTAHPQALAQCRQWLDEHLPRTIRTAVSSNAEAAVQAASRPDAAAIAGQLAADIYELPVVAENIEDEPDNTTRFLVLGRHDALPTGTDRTSIVCSVPNRPGALEKLLAILAAAGINMTKLESRPAKAALWEYVFFIDIDGHRGDPSIARALQALEEQSLFVKVLGSYPKAAR